MRLYYQFLPFVAQNRTAALILLHTLITNEAGIDPVTSEAELRLNMIISDIIMHDENGSSLTARLVASRISGGSDWLTEFTKTI